MFNYCDKQSFRINSYIIDTKNKMPISLYYIKFYEWVSIRLLNIL